MREISVKEVENVVSSLCIKANKILPEDLKYCIEKSVNNEDLPLAKSINENLVKNLSAAQSMDIPICQDTGMAIIFIEIGQDVHFVDGNLNDAINAGVAKGYTEGFLRKSIVSDPLRRANTGDNTPAIIHTSIVPGNKVKITVAPKGFGSENMSKLKMLTPAATPDDIVDYVVSVVKEAGSNPCPPMVLGVGIGGDFEGCAILAKKALCRPVSKRHPDEFYRNLEEKMLKRINELGIGPQGFGGNTTALAVNIEYGPTHIAGLPVSVNVGCHVTRHASQTI
ncbi:MAG: fumarate hydratase [Oscillospiraceae bacterium]|nr:fumarate hydratase [Oscillospiraceae bacterium]